MTKRRDLFVLAPSPGRAEEAREALSEWLQNLDDHPGYLGGSVLSECANELLPDTLVLMLEFESTEAVRSFWPRIRGTKTPVAADGEDRNPADQGGVLFDMPHDHSDSGHTHQPTLNYDRGNGLFARLLHVHCEVTSEHAASAESRTAATA